MTLRPTFWGHSVTILDGLQGLNIMWSELFWFVKFRGRLGRNHKWWKRGGRNIKAPETIQNKISLANQFAKRCE